MGIRHDVEQGLEKYEITKIDGQPTDEDLNLLIKELTNAAGSVATRNGGGEHGHVGMVIDEAEYITFSRSGTRFVVPTNPGPYPATVDTDKVIRERQIAEHKADCNEYETYLGIENCIRRMIVKSIDHEWLAEVESETMGFNHLSPKDLLTHLRSAVEPSITWMSRSSSRTSKNHGMALKPPRPISQEATNSNVSC